MQKYYKNGLEREILVRIGKKNNQNKLLKFGDSGSSEMSLNNVLQIIVKKYLLNSV